MPIEVKKKVGLESLISGLKTQPSCSNFSTSFTTKLIFHRFSSHGSICANRMLTEIHHMLERMWVRFGGVMLCL